MRSKRIKLTIVLLVMGFAFAVWVATYHAYVDTIRPNSLGITMNDLQHQIGPPESSAPHFHNGSRYTIWRIPAKLVFLPSGPPVYVFDSAGKLVDWTRDIGDDPEFRAKWGL